MVGQFDESAACLMRTKRTIHEVITKLHEIVRCFVMLRVTSWIVSDHSKQNSGFSSDQLISATGFSRGFNENLSVQRIRPVTCIATNKVTTEPMVIARPVKPFKKNAYENITR